MFLSHVYVSLPLSPSLPLSLKINFKKRKRKRMNAVISNVFHGS